jgi:hypothetical protein
MPDTTVSQGRGHGRGQHTTFAPARAAALEDAADLARLAPSIHNTQPWALVLGHDRLIVRADRTRQLSAIDPSGRALVMSIGAALFNARVGLATAGWVDGVTRIPRPDDPDLLAELHPVMGRPSADLAALERAIRRRRTNRRRFSAEQVPDDVMRRLSGLVAQEHTLLVPIVRPEDRALAARLTREADRRQSADPSYRAELRTWTTRATTAGDGVPASAVPHTDGRRHDALPIRDFDTEGAGALPPETASGTDQSLILLATPTDDALAWLRAGEAMERVLLELTCLDWAASPVTQAIEVRETRDELGTALTPGAHPQMLLRIGRAATPVATPRRRRIDAVRNSARPAEPIPVHPQPARQTVDARAARPVSDGRGGTVWT